MGRIIQKNNGKTTVFTTGENFNSLTPITNTYYVGVDLSSGYFEKLNPTGSIINLETAGSTFTGGTVSGSTNFTNNLSANTISATTYYNLPLSTSGLSDVLNQDNYANGYDIILNAGAKLSSGNNDGGADTMQIIEGYINIQSTDGIYDTTQLYSTPTQTGIRKNNNQTGTPEATIDLFGNGVSIQSQSIDNFYANNLRFLNDGTRQDNFTFNDGTTNAFITKETILDTEDARIRTEHYIKNNDGEFSLRKIETPYQSTTTVDDGFNRMRIYQSENINISAQEIGVSESYVRVQPDVIKIESVDSASNIGSLIINPIYFSIQTPSNVIESDGSQISIVAPQIVLSSPVTNLRLFIPQLQVHNNNAAALAAGLVATEVYRTGDGTLKIVI